MGTPYTINKTLNLGVNTPFAAARKNFKDHFNLENYRDSAEFIKSEIGSPDKADFIDKFFNQYESASSPSELKARLDLMNLDLLGASLGNMESDIDNLGFSIINMNQLAFNGASFTTDESSLFSSIREQISRAQNILESSIRKALADPNINEVDKQRLETFLTNLKASREANPESIQAQGKSVIDLNAWINTNNSSPTDSKSLSEAGIQALKKIEGYSAKAYYDYSQYTNGYGTKAAFAGEVINPETAEIRLREDLKHREAFINRVAQARLEKTGKGLTQAQFDSLTLMVYNLGLGQAHEVHQAVIDGKDELVPKLMNKYVHAGGNVLSGLVSRRQQEASLYNLGTAQLTNS